MKKNNGVSLIVHILVVFLLSSCSQKKDAVEINSGQSRESEWQVKFDAIRSIEVSDQKQAIDLCFDLQREVMAYGSNEWIIKVKIQEARLYFYAGLMEKSTACYLEAIELLKSASNVGLNHLDAHIGLGAILLTIGSNEAAEEAFLKAHTFLDSKTDYYVRSYSSILANLGSTYIYLARYHEADSVMQLGISFLIRNDTTHANLKRMYNNMAKLKNILGEYDEAIRYSGKVQAWESKNSGLYSLALSYLFEAEVYLNMRDTLQAKSKYFQALQISDSFALPVPLAGAARGLSALYQQSGQNDSALYYVNLNQTAVAQSNTAEAAQKIGAQAIKDYYEQQIQKLKSNNDKASRFGWLVILSTLFSLGVFGFFLFRYRMGLIALKEKKIEEKRIQDSLEQQKAALILKLDELNKLDQEQQSLEYAAKAVFENLLKKASDLSANLASNEGALIKKALPKEDFQTWEKLFHEFEEAFMAEDAIFMNVLSERFPGLTINDRRLCVFIRKGMTNFEIATLTKKSGATILTAKSRLRSSLGIADQAISLEAFLQSL